MSERDVERLVQDLQSIPGDKSLLEHSMEKILQSASPVLRQVVRLCAIPHWFTPEIIGVLRDDVHTDVNNSALFGEIVPAPPAAERLAGIDSIFPNPFNPRAEILYRTTAAGPVRLDIYTAAGRHVRTLVEAFAGSGDHRAQWNGTDGQGNPVAGGSYICRMQSPDGKDSRRLTLLK